MFCAPTCSPPLRPQQLTVHSTVSSIFAFIYVNNITVIFLSTKSPSFCNFVSTGAIARSRAFFGRGTGPILLDQVACTGTETRLVNCRSNPLGVHDCSHSEDAGVTCQGMHGYLCYLTCVPSIQLLHTP